MLRLRQPSLWAALAVLALALLLVAPPIGRWQQARSGVAALQIEALCSGGGLRLAPPAHAGHHDDDGLAHAPACDYCLLAARLLPWVALLLALLPWCCAPGPRVAARGVFVEADVHRAHPARGPPLFS